MIVNPSTIRDWDPEHEKMGKGITLSREELLQFKEHFKSNGNLSINQTMTFIRSIWSKGVWLAPLEWGQVDGRLVPKPSMLPPNTSVYII